MPKHVLIWQHSPTAEHPRTGLRGEPPAVAEALVEAGVAQLPNARGVKLKPLTKVVEATETKVVASNRTRRKRRTRAEAE